MTEALSVNGALWVSSPIDLDSEQRLAKALGISRLVARTMARRGIDDPTKAGEFLNPSLDRLHDPALLPDFEVGMREVLGARERGEKIFVHGDYDVDGVTSAALLGRFLEKIGCDVHVHVPHRIKEGYGIHTDAVAAAETMGAKLFLTCDCGISALRSIDEARAKGMRVVVTDHHEVGETLPNAHAVINPHRSDSRYPFSNLSGVGVAFKFAAGIARERGIKLEQYYRAYLDLATLGTVADVMPLVDENRIIVANGLPQVLASQKEGLKALLQVIFGENMPTSGLKARHIGFQLGPRLNAAGRIDDAAVSLRLLLSKEPKEAKEIAEMLDGLNTQRRLDQDEILAQAIEHLEATNQMNEHALAIAGPWHPGLIGIVAGKLVDRFARPAFVMSVSESGVKGSARSIRGYHLAEALHRVSHLLSSHGGHELAAGFGLGPGGQDALISALHDDARQHLPADLLTPRLGIDAWVEGHEADLDAATDLEKLQPFGQENEEPTFACRNVRLEKIRPTKNPNVFQFDFLPAGSARAAGFGFGLAETVTRLQEGENYDVAFRLELDEFRGRRQAKWRVLDFRPV